MNAKVNSILVITFFTCLIAAATDWAIGGWLLEVANITTRERGQAELRVSHPTYHHDLAPNYSGIVTWGGHEFNYCTNSAGERKNCANTEDRSSKNSNIWIIGDSFMEGVGVDFPNTVFGLIESKYANTSFANLSVVSYSPSIYLMKIKDRIERGYRPKHVIVFIDISDIQDEGIRDIRAGKVVDVASGKQPIPADRKGRGWLRMNFPMTYTFYKLTRDFLELRPPPFIYRKDFERGTWTLPHSRSYTSYGPGGVEMALEKATTNMLALSELLKQHGATLNVVTYPWPSQILHDDLKNSRQELHWAEFCSTRCDTYTPLFDATAAYVSANGKQNTVKDMFIDRDVHWNIAGSRFIFSKIDPTLQLIITSL